MPSVPIAARQLRAVPPIVVKYPPTYTVDPDTANAYTMPSAVGFQEGSTVPSELMWARLLRVCPRTEVKPPPM
ncbi:MAG: hypothetical protein WCP28_17050 [Actinomycetes bacterium]